MKSTFAEPWKSLEDMTYASTYLECLHTFCVCCSRQVLSAYTEYRILNGAEGGNNVSSVVSLERTNAIILPWGGNATKKSWT